MHFLIIGASGRNGLLTVEAALASQHTVTALVRNPSSLPASISSNTNLTIVKGTPQSEKDISRALVSPRAPDAVIFALNARRTSENPFAALAADSPADLLTSSMKILLSAISKSNVGKPKLVINSCVGVGTSWRALPWIMRALFTHSTMSVVIEDQTNLDLLVRESGLPFVLARPPRLTPEPAKDVKVLPDDGKGLGFMSAVSRESLAAWMVKAAESNQWDGTAPVIIN